MKEGKLYRWSKSIDRDQSDWWETELIAADVAYVIEDTANRKRLRLTAYETTREAAESLLSRFGGGVSGVRPEDWQHQAESGTAPLRIRDRFVVTRSPDDSEIEKLRREFPGREVLSFPARLAFGTGNHPTTAWCLRLLVDEIENATGWPMLDLGCGSGILSVAAAKLGADPVVALERDPAALAVARENGRRHGVSRRVRWIEADVVDWISGTDAAGFRVIGANLFSELLIAILPHLPRRLAPGGSVILSGFLTSQAKDVHDAAVRSGIRLDRFIRRGKWVTASGSLA